MNVGPEGLFLAFIIFAGGAYLGVKGLELAVGYVRTVRKLDGEALAAFDDRLIGGLALVTGFVGAYNAQQHVAIPSLVVVGIVCIVLDYACCADLRFGRVPIFVSVPLAVVACLLDLLNGDVASVAVGFIIALPFAFVAFRSHGRSSGYGDSGIAALGGFMLGAQLGILAVAVSCFAAAGTGFALKRQGGSVPFAPFLAVTLQFALLVPFARSLAQ